MQIGILGGTFDPPHLGHLMLAESAMLAGSLDYVIFIPTRNPPHKDSSKITSSEHRLAMLKMLISHNERFLINDFELSRDSIGYTIDTLRYLKGLYASASFRLIIGSDMALSFHRWRSPEEIISLAPPLVANREGILLHEHLFSVLDMPKLIRDSLISGIFSHSVNSISSTGIRMHLGKQSTSQELSLSLPKDLLEYINTHKLYL